jgi:hypothetical protein
LFLILFLLLSSFPFLFCLYFTFFIHFVLQICFSYPSIFLSPLSPFPNTTAPPPSAPCLLAPIDTIDRTALSRSTLSQKRKSVICAGCSVSCCHSVN